MMQNQACLLLLSSQKNWTKHIGAYFSKDCDLKIGNYKQTLPFHYQDKEFLTDEIIVKLEKKIGL